MPSTLSSSLIDWTRASNSWVVTEAGRVTFRLLMPSAVEGGGFIVQVGEGAGFTPTKKTGRPGSVAFLFREATPAGPLFLMSSAISIPLINVAVINETSYTGVDEFDGHRHA